MKDLIIQQTKNTPTVEFMESGKMLIEGKSLPFDGQVFFEPLIEWISTLKSRSVIFTIKLEIINSISVRFLRELLQDLSDNSFVKDIFINWFYEEDDEIIYELGKSLKEKYKFSNFYLHEIDTEYEEDKKYFWMNNLELVKTFETPHVKFTRSGKLELIGKIIPIDATSFFELLNLWVKHLDAETVNFDIKLEHINTNSIEKLLALLFEIEKNINIKNIIINWLMEDDNSDIQKLGKLFEEILERSTFNHKNKKDIQVS